VPGQERQDGWRLAPSSPRRPPRSTGRPTLVDIEPEALCQSQCPPRRCTRRDEPNPGGSTEASDHSGEGGHRQGGPTAVSREPGPVSPRHRGRVPKVSASNRATLSTMNRVPPAPRAAARVGTDRAQFWASRHIIRWTAWQEPDTTRCPPDTTKPQVQRPNSGAYLGLPDWHPQRDSNPCRHLERPVTGPHRVLSSACAQVGDLLLRTELR
jgi:hypothetical protein